ncbi:hypothetical protein X975_12374, partial [Stegodyphus mimosarum]
MSPIEHVWDVIGRRLARDPRPVASADELWVDLFCCIVGDLLLYPYFVVKSNVTYNEKEENGMKEVLDRDIRR